MSFSELALMRTSWSWGAVALVAAAAGSAAGAPVCCAMAACARHRASGVRANRVAWRADGPEDERRRASEERGDTAREGREDMGVPVESGQKREVHWLALCVRDAGWL